MAIKFLLKNCKLIILIGIELEFYVTSADIVAQFLKESTLAQHPYFGEIKGEKEILQYELITKPTLYTNKLALFVEAFKANLNDIALKIGEKVLFEAKPFNNLAGSSLHINMSFFNIKARNFLAKYDELFLFAIGGLCSNLEQTMLYFAPFCSSYKRFFTENIDVPRVIGWGFNNRSVAIRIPNGSPHRIEHRVAGADCAVEKVIEVIITSIAYGIENKIAPAAPIYGIPNLWQIEGQRLPFSYTEALKKYKEVKTV